jgi:hypothetical protein
MWMHPVGTYRRGSYVEGPRRLGGPRKGPSSQVRTYNLTFTLLIITLLIITLLSIIITLLIIRVDDQG